MQEFKFGKLPFIYTKQHLKLSNYMNTDALPPLPVSHTYKGKISADGWGMLLNDKIGDCVIAGIMHQIMAFTEEGIGTPVKVTDEDTQKYYSIIAGYDPKRPETDIGTNPEVAYNYWLKNGLPDANGKFHKIDAWIVVNYENMQLLKYALYLFGTLGVGVNFPKSAMIQFKEGETWTDKGDTFLLGGHYIMGAGYTPKTMQVVTWGKMTEMTFDFMQQYGIEVLLPISKEMLDEKGVTDEGFNWTQLMNDLTVLPNVEPSEIPNDPYTPEPRYDVAELVLVIGSQIMTAYIGDQGYFLTPVLDVTPEIKNNRTMLPVGLLASYMGMEPEYNGGVVTLKGKDITFVLTIGSNEMVVQKQNIKYTVYLDQAPYIKGGRTFCPIGLIADALGWLVRYDEGPPFVVRLINPNIVRA